MKLLLAPGLGDIHWVLLKMEDFIQRHCAGEVPEIWIWDFDGRQRSEGLIERVPFVKKGGYWSQSTAKYEKMFRDLYLHGNRDIEWSFAGEFDAFICPNGSISNGMPWQNVLHEYATNWSYPVTETNEDALEAEKIAEKLGPLILTGFSNFGMFHRSWAAHLPPDRCANILRRIPATVVLTGSQWDQQYCNQLSGVNIVNLVGKTSVGVFLSLLRRCRGMIGWCGGNTILSTHLGTPTACIWSKFFPAQGFRTNWVEPARVGTTYFPLEVEALDDGKLVEMTTQWLA